MNLGRRIYFDKATGNILVDKGEHEGILRVPTVDQDIESYISLSERNRETFDYIELNYGEFSQDFAESNGVRVNPNTKELEFSYPDPNEPEAPQIFRKPLSEEVERLKAEDLNNKEAIAELYLLSMGGF
ncbi:hypothetical protein MKY29_11915 [Psychrobacillus sp. FSL K6-2365]|uniref:hypothetical protein n=1 Tax=Psychrobacillus sp. FSL K6-2365 TaxID=2921546 RepID=UPI0030F989BF